MKSLLTIAALLAGLSAPAFAGDTASPPPPAPQAQAALAPSQGEAVADGQPQSPAAEVVPMSAPLDANAAPPSRGGGCGHSKSTVYLTN